MGNRSASARQVHTVERHDRADGESSLLYSDSDARDMSDAPSIYTQVTAETLNAHSREWADGYAAVVSYVCRYGGPPAATAKTHGFPVGRWLDAQHAAQLSGMQRAALMSIPGVTLSRSRKSPVRGRSVERNAAWIRIQAWAYARFAEKR